MISKLNSRKFILSLFYVFLFFQNVFAPHAQTTDYYDDNSSQPSQEVYYDHEGDAVLFTHPSTDLFQNPPHEDINDHSPGSTPLFPEDSSDDDSNSEVSSIEVIPNPEPKPKRQKRSPSIDNDNPETQPEAITICELEEFFNRKYAHYVDLQRYYPNNYSFYECLKCSIVLGYIFTDIAKNLAECSWIDLEILITSYLDANKFYKDLSDIEKAELEKVIHTFFAKFKKQHAVCAHFDINLLESFLSFEEEVFKNYQPWIRPYLIFDLRKCTLNFRDYDCLDGKFSYILYNCQDELKKRSSLSKNQKDHDNRLTMNNQSIIIKELEKCIKECKQIYDNEHTKQTKTIPDCCQAACNISLKIYDCLANNITFRH